MLLHQDRSKPFAEGQLPTSCTLGMVRTQVSINNVREEGRGNVDPIATRPTRRSPPTSARKTTI